MSKGSMSEIIVPYCPDHFHFCSCPSRSYRLIRTFPSKIRRKCASNNRFSLSRNCIRCKRHLHINTTHHTNSRLLIFIFHHRFSFHCSIEMYIKKPSASILPQILYFFLLKQE